VTAHIPDIEAAFTEETNRLTAEWLPVGAVAFAIIFGASWPIEHQSHPERDFTFALIYCAELLTLAIAVLLSRRPWWRARGRALTVATFIILLFLIGTYHASMRAEGEVLVMALLYLETGAMVLFPWGWQGQLPIAVAAVATYGLAVLCGERLATPLAINFLGIAPISALSVGGAAFMARQRLAFLRQAAELRAANTALADANQSKNHFLAGVSHELRTPLNIVVGYTDLLIEGHFGAFPADVQEVLERVARNTRSLMYLINDLLDLSRIEAGRLSVQLAPVKLAPLFADMARFVEPKLQAGAVRFRVDAPDSLMVIADRSRLEQILINLLSNAAKFTPQGAIELRARAVGAAVAIEVVDTGVGIDPTELSKIFEPFSQGMMGRQLGGVGIGLSLSRRLAEAMGGELSVTSQAGIGSTFALRLPAPRA